jgi:hypothetical protein
VCACVAPVSCGGRAKSEVWPCPRVCGRVAGVGHGAGAGIAFARVGLVGAVLLLLRLLSSALVTKMPGALPSGPSLRGAPVRRGESGAVTRTGSGWVLSGIWAEGGLYKLIKRCLITSCRE